MVPGFFSVWAIDPEAPDRRIEALIPKEVLYNYYKTHPVTWHNVVVAKEVLENPARIYYGIRDHQKGGWCYTGRPMQFWKKPGITVPLPTTHLFTVYMNPSYHVYLWRLEKVDPQDLFAPIDWRERYGGMSWKRDS